MGKHVTFKPYEITVEVPDGENLLRAALMAGVHINASCGGEGVCGKCRVLLESGELTSTRSGLLSDEEWDLGYRQACQSFIQVRRGDPHPAGVPAGPAHPDPPPERRRTCAPAPSTWRP